MRAKTDLTLVRAESLLWEGVGALGPAEVLRAAVAAWDWEEAPAGRVRADRPVGQAALGAVGQVAPSLGPAEQVEYRAAAPLRTPRPLWLQLR